MSYLQESCKINCHVCRKWMDVIAPPCCFIFLRCKLLYILCIWLCSARSNVLFFFICVLGEASHCWRTKHRCQIWSFSKCNNSGPMMDVSLRALGGISAYTCLGWDLPKLSEFQVHKERECCASSSKRLTEIVCIIYHLVVACGHKYSLELGMSSTTTDTLLNLMTTFFNVSAKSK